MELIIGELTATIKKMLSQRSGRGFLMVPCPGFVRTVELIGGRLFRMRIGKSTFVCSWSNFYHYVVW